MVHETGLKVLLLDQETTPIVSMVMTQTQLLAKEVYLIDRIEKTTKDKMKHLKCVCFLRPTVESIQYLVEELRDPHYGQYHLFFTNILKKSQIERLAETDEFEVVKEIQEYYGDFIAVHPDLFHFQISQPQFSLYSESSHLWEAKSFQRCVEGLVSVLLALKKRPLIRYAKNSPMAKRLGSEIHYQMQQEAQLFDFRRPDTPPILLILDRRNDPVTPLLQQWTYEAMVHELLEIKNGRVDLSHLPDIRPELKEIVLNADQDPFYKKNMYLNLGDLGLNIKQYVDEYQTKTKSNMKIESITEMKRFVEEYPEFRKLSGNVSKHVSLVSELSKRVEREGLLEVGELDQSFACYENHSNDLKSLQDILLKQNVPSQAKLNLVLLYGLRYEKFPNQQLPLLLDALRGQSIEEQKIKGVVQFLKYCGADQRQEDIFLNESILSKSKNVFRGLQGVENVYTQHTPNLASILDSLIKGKLKELQYPFIDQFTRDKPQDVIVFMVGGVTYSEAKVVSQLNASQSGVKIVLGGSFIHNSRSYWKEITEAAHKWTDGSYLSQ